MKKKSKLFLLLLIGILLFPNIEGKAEEERKYENDNGVILTQKEYDFINEFYGSNFFKKMTTEDYEWIQDLNINTTNVEIQTVYENNNNSRTTLHQTSNKRITIAKSCTTICTIMTNVTWLNNPVVRSYDVIGARFVNTELASDVVTTKMYSSSGTKSSSNVKYTATGLGVSIKLDSGVTDISLDQKFYVNTGGYVYASYQHAITTVTLDTSTSYLINSSGYGGVFSFYGDAVGCYDQMAGVYITT